MPVRPIILGCLLSAVAVAWAVYAAQSADSTALVVRVQPEAVLNITRLPLEFRVTPRGEANTVTTTIAARVRAQSGESIAVLVRPAGDLQGPAGTIPAAAVEWQASKAMARGGAEDAACAPGQLGAGRSLTAGWKRSGILSCAVRFRLTNPGTWPAGTYSTDLFFAIQTGP
jgi:hypothetical protein